MEAFDRNKDYSAEIEKLMPGWTPPVVIQAGYDLREQAITDGNDGLRGVRMDNGEVAIQPYQRYMRAVDQAGNMLAIPIQTCRAHEDPSGYSTTIIHRKQAEGFLIAETNIDGMRLSRDGKEGQAYLHYILTEREKRMAANREHQKKREADLTDRMTRELLEQQKQNTAAIVEAIKTAGGGSGPSSDVAALQKEIAELKAAMRELSAAAKGRGKNAE